MAGSFNGFGTSYYGECDFRPDGSYVTTEWFIAIYLPVFPLRSRRVIRNEGGDRNWGVYNSESYILLETLPVNWLQALRVWLFAAVCFPWSLGGFFYLMSLNRKWPGHGWWLVGAGIAGAVLPWIMPWMLRNRARRQAGFSEEALLATFEKLTGTAPAPPPLPATAAVSAPPPIPGPGAAPVDHDRFKPRI